MRLLIVQSRLKEYPVSGTQCSYENKGMVGTKANHVSVFKASAGMWNIVCLLTFN